MAIKVKKGGVYADPVGIFAKKAGVYSAVTGVSAKVAGAYATVSAVPSMRAIANLKGSPQQISAGNPEFSAEDGYTLTEPLAGVLEVWFDNYITAQGGGAVGGGCSDIATGGVGVGRMQARFTHPTLGVQTVDLLDKTNGTLTVTAPAGGNFKGVLTDAILVANAGTKIYVKLAGNIPGGVPFSLGKAGSDSKFQFGTTPIPIGNTPVQTFPSFLAWYGPSVIAGLGVKPVVAIGGDSTDDGLKDMPNDASNAIGVFGRLFAAAGIACVNLSGRGERARSFAIASNSPRRSERLAFATFGALGNVINDLADGTTAAAIMGYQDAIAARFGMPCMLRTANPFTTGGIATPWNSAGEIQRQAYNAVVRARPVYFDPDSVLSTGAAGGWLNEDAVSVDYLHPTNLGDAWSAANGALVGTSVGAHGLAARAAGATYPSWGANLFTFNRDPSNAAWTKNDTTILTGQPDAECGSTAQKVREAATTAKHSIAEGPISVTAGTYEVWMDLAAGGRDWFFYQIIDSNLGFAFQVLKWFNTLTGALGNTFVTAGGASNLNFVSASITPIDGSAGFNRHKLTFTVGAAVTGVYVSAKLDTGNGADATYLGDITKGTVARPQMWLRKIA